MSWLRTILKGLRGLLRRDDVERELEDELTDFLDRTAEAHRERGLTGVEAARAARAEIGSRAALKDEVRAGFWEWSVVNFWRDLRYGARMVRRTPAFSAVAILTLAIGLGATTAVVSVADAVLLRALPVQDPQSLVLFRWTAPRPGMPPISIAGMAIDAVTGEGSSSAFSYAAFREFQTSTRTLTDVVAYTSATASPSAPGLNDGATGQLVSGNYFTALGTRPQLGRLLSPDDDRSNAPLVAAISDRYWRKTYGRDPGVVGQTLRLTQARQVQGPGGPTTRLESTPAEIVGVAPAGFTGTGPLGDVPDFFLPMLPGASASGNKFAARLSTAWVWPFRVFGRMRPGVTKAEVERDLAGAFQTAVQEAWSSNPRRSDPPNGSAQLIVAAGGQGPTGMRSSLARGVGILAAIVAVLLLIVCINLANLLLARAESRRAEMAVRLSIGAGRGRLVRQLVTEVGFITLCGAAAGLVVARWTKDAALAWVSRTSPGFEVTTSLDLRVLSIAAGLALAVAVIVGLVPALRATRVDPNPTLKGERSITARGRHVLGRGLLVAQVALAVVLVVTAGLFVRTLRNLQTADVGFNASGLLLFDVNRVSPPTSEKRAAAETASALDLATDRIGMLPGVRAVAFSEHALIEGDLAMPFLHVPGQPKRADEDRTVYTQAVSPTFFSTMEMPIVSGRAFATADRTAPVAIVNETLARRFFASTEALGHQIAITKDPAAATIGYSQLLEIVGIVRDAKYMTIRETPLPTVFYPNADSGRAVFAVRSGGDTVPLVPAIQQTLRDITPVLVPSEFRTQTEQTARTLAQEQHFAWISSLFGILALLLTSIGLYGLLSYRVARRTREIGIRVALGASRSRVVRNVLGEMLVLVAAGVAVGLGAAAAVTRLVQSTLFGLAASDPISQAIAAGLMLVIAITAALVPARRATQVDPVAALRSE